MDKIRWGILSTGWIASQFAEGLQSVDDAELIAVGSRSQSSADEFSNKYNIPHAHDSYEALVNDPDVDVIYIGTPHTFHAENTMLCLNAGKHVLCEKPFTINADEAEACIKLAREKNLFLMEAIWMRFIPAIVEIQRLVSEGTIGDITLIEADFSFYVPFDANHRLFNLELGGGALLDVGIYPISFANLFLGMPQKTASHAIMSQTGADEQCSMLFNYEKAAALLFASISGDMPISAVIKGTKGRIDVHPVFFVPQSFTLQIYGEDEQLIEMPMTGNGYNYEAQAVHKALRAGEIEVPQMSHDETLATMKLMDSLRESWGLVYPQEA